MKPKTTAIVLTLFACVSLALPVAAAEEQQKAAETGTVVFYRTRSAKGGAIGLNITGGDTGAVGVLSNGSKIIKELPVGEFTFVVTAPSLAGRDSVTLHVKAGKTYYVKGQAKLGWPAARARFTLMDEAKGKAESDKIE